MKLVVESWFVPMLKWYWDNRKDVLSSDKNFSTLPPKKFQRELTSTQDAWINEWLDVYLKSCRKFETFVEAVVQGIHVPIEVKR